MTIKIIKPNKYKLPLNACIKVQKNDTPYASRLIREGIAEKVTEKEYAEWVSYMRLKDVKQKEECEECKKKNVKCKKCN